MAAFPLFISAVSPSEAPLRAIYGALFLGKLIMRTQPGCSSANRPALSHLGWNCSDTPNQSSGKRSSPEQPHPYTSRPLILVNTRHYSNHNCIKTFTVHSKNTIPLDPLTGKGAIVDPCIWLNSLIDHAHWLFINAFSLLPFLSNTLTLHNQNN